MVLAWLMIILFGAVMLRLPASSAGEPLVWLDAVFTSTSAVCVTGLSTIDVGHRLSGVGQGALLVLMQLGGLGISILSTVLFAMAGQATLSRQYQAQDALAAVRIKPLRLLAWVIPTVFVAEATGAAIIASRLGGGRDAWWQGVFHSVSAFCNAGFSLYPDNLARLRSDGWCLATIMLLIATGGLGFITLYQVFQWALAAVTRRRFPLFLHSRVVLVSSLWLWGLGAVMFAVFEWRHTMAGLSAGGKLLSALFQSVTTRTAGFSTLDFGSMRTPTLLFTTLLMLVGGAPGSCAGGLKVTTLAVILATIRARTRDLRPVALMQRTVPQDIVLRAFHIVALALLYLAAITVLMLIAEEGQAWTGQQPDRLVAVSFEAASALGTVGLSTGITPGLSASGKLLVIVTMFVGRLGPLMIALALFRPRPGVAFEYPKEELAVG